MSLFHHFVCTSPKSSILLAQSLVHAPTSPGLHSLLTGFFILLALAQLTHMYIPVHYTYNKVLLQRIKISLLHFGDSEPFSLTTSFLHILKRSEEGRDTLKNSVDIHKARMALTKGNVPGCLRCNKRSFAPSPWSRTFLRALAAQQWSPPLSTPWTHRDPSHAHHMDEGSATS